MRRVALLACLVASTGPGMAQETARGLPDVRVVRGTVGQFELPNGYGLPKPDAPVNPSAGGYSVHQIYGVQEGRAFGLALTQQCNPSALADMGGSLGEVGRAGLLAAMTGSIDVKSAESVDVGGRPAKRYMGPLKKRDDADRIAWIIDYPHGMAVVALVYPRGFQVHQALVPAIEGMRVDCGGDVRSPAVDRGVTTS